MTQEELPQNLIRNRKPPGEAAIVLPPTPSSPELKVLTTQIKNQVSKAPFLYPHSTISPAPPVFIPSADMEFLLSTSYLTKVPHRATSDQSDFA